MIEEDFDNEAEEEFEKKGKGAWIGFFIFLTVLLAAFFAFRSYWTKTFGGVQVDGRSMNMTLQHGENLLMKYVFDGQGVERGDVIVVYVGGYEEFKDTETEYLIKRLIAVEGDKVKCENGVISICYAGTEEYVVLDESSYVYYKSETVKEEYDFAEYVVGEGEIFFLGDNRGNSIDSRYNEEYGSHLEDRLYQIKDVYGVVPKWAIEHRAILGKIFFREGFLMKLIDAVKERLAAESGALFEAQR